ncbi:MAG TPA: twin-arginine translocase subunit TatC [Candidatus Saccharimonadales bacterium]|nr:twin-arginine translocase subunit TatC [Candidatus Saccharimonadales bacterium]
MTVQSNSEQTFAQHLTELKNRSLYSALSIVIGSVIGYIYRVEILKFLILPLKQSIYYTSPVGGFDLTFKVSILFGVIVSFPVIVYQILKFLQPAIPQNYKMSLDKFLVASWMLLMMGVATAYYLSLPAALNFLSEFGSDQVRALISAQDYFIFVLSYLGGFGLLFQLPIIMLLIHKITPLNPKKLLHYLRYVILVSFIVAAILTPTPDPINQTIMALPIILLYVITIGIISIYPKPVYVKQ